MKEIRRTLYLERIKRYLDKPIIKVIIGMRRVGKSTLLKQIIRDVKRNKNAKIIYINKEDIKFDFMTTYTELNKFIKEQIKNQGNRKIYLFIDEIQRIKQWEKAIVSFALKKNIDIIITGSTSAMFSSELSTLLGGRYIEIPIYTLSFNEFLSFKKTASVESMFSDFIKYGGLPGIHYFENDEESVKQYIESIYNTIVLKDIIERHRIKNVVLLERIFNFAIDNIGNFTSARSIVRFLKSQNTKIGTDTVLNYLKYFQMGYLLHKTNRYDIEGKKVMEINSKYYVADIGLANIFSNKHIKGMSGLLENIVYLHLRTMEYKVYVGKYKNNEIDFIAEKGKRKVYIQVTLSLVNEKAREREYASLLKINDNYEKIILSMDPIWQSDYKGILWQYIPNFLLEFK